MLRPPMYKKSKNRPFAAVPTAIAALPFNLLRSQLYPTNKRLVGEEAQRYLEIMAGRKEVASILPQKILLSSRWKSGGEFNDYQYRPMLTTAAALEHLSKPSGVITQVMRAQFPISAYSMEQAALDRGLRLPQPGDDPHPLPTIGMPGPAPGRSMPAGGGRVQAPRELNHYAETVMAVQENGARARLAGRDAALAQVGALRSRLSSMPFS